MSWREPKLPGTAKGGHPGGDPEPQGFLKQPPEKEPFSKGAPKHQEKHAR